MDAFTPLDQSHTSFTSPITDFDMNDWITDADDWNTFSNFDALPVAQPSGFASQEVGDGLRYTTSYALQHDLAGPCGQRQLEAEIQNLNHTHTTINHFGTGGLGPTNDPTGFEHVPVGFTDPWRTDMSYSEKAEVSELGQGSFNPTWTDSTVPDNGDGNNDAPSVITTSVAPGRSRECSCIICVDLGSERQWSWGSKLVDYPCRLTDCNSSAPQEGKWPDGYDDQRAARKHEKNHFRHEGQFRCIEDRCVYGTKRWSDLTRHYTSKHCLNPKTKFPCPEIGCKYGGNNGFTRKDKLKSHREKVHEKHGKAEKRFRVNKPNAQGAA